MRKSMKNKIALSFLKGREHNKIHRNDAFRHEVKRNELSVRIYSNATHELAWHMKGMYKGKISKNVLYGVI